ncbi:MAG: hypothetical protein ACRERS_02605 [Methylococcales bacterium]
MNALESHAKPCQDFAGFIGYFSLVYGCAMSALLDFFYPFARKGSGRSPLRLFD